MEKTRRRARWVASRWAALPARGQAVGAGRPGGTRETGWGSPCLDSRAEVKPLATSLWDGRCCAPLHSIYRSVCPVPSRLRLCSPHSEPANTLIFLEQWCQLLGPPLAWLFLFNQFCFSFSLPPNSACPFSLARCTADAPIFAAQEIPLSGSMCVRLCATAYVSVGGIYARALACRALTARSFGFVSRMDVWTWMGTDEFVRGRISQPSQPTS